MGIVKNYFIINTDQIPYLDENCNINIKKQFDDIKLKN